MRKKIIYFTVAFIFGVGALIYALMYTPEPRGGAGQIVTKETLSQKTGINGEECWVAVDGVVYSISGFSEWQMGKHIPSEGKATCGQDLSGVIGESPHGRSVLNLLRVVGTLAS